jgi:hypothetical protein
MNKTYSERRQAAYFQAARALYKVSSDILDDVVLDSELLGATLPWAVGKAAETRLQAVAMEDLGRSEGTYIAPSTERSLTQADARYFAARTLLEMRVRRAASRVAA